MGADGGISSQARNGTESPTKFSRRLTHPADVPGRWVAEDHPLSAPQWVSVRGQFERETGRSRCYRV